MEKTKHFMRPKFSMIPLPVGNAGSGLPAGFASRWFQILPDGQKLAKVFTSSKKNTRLSPTIIGVDV